jgi:hypothetical protein
LFIDIPLQGFFGATDQHCPFFTNIATNGRNSASSVVKSVLEKPGGKPVKFRLCGITWRSTAHIVNILSGISLFHSHPDKTSEKYTARHKKSNLKFSGNCAI